MGILKIGAGISSVAIALAFSTVAFAEGPVVNSEVSCTAQDGSVMDLQGIKHCLVAVVPAEFQGVEYAGEIKGVHSCKKANTRKTQIGDFCLLALEAKPAVVVPSTATTQTAPVVAPETETAEPTIVDQLKEVAEDEAKKEAKKQVRKKLFGK